MPGTVDMQGDKFHVFAQFVHYSEDIILIMNSTCSASSGCHPSFGDGGSIGGYGSTKWAAAAGSTTSVSQVRHIVPASRKKTHITHHHVLNCLSICRKKHKAQSPPTMVYTIIVHLYAKADEESITKLKAKLVEASQVYSKDKETLSWFVMQDTVDPRKFSIVERYLQESVSLCVSIREVVQTKSRKGM